MKKKEVYFPDKEIIIKEDEDGFVLEGIIRRAYEVEVYSINSLTYQMDYNRIYDLNKKTDLKRLCSELLNYLELFLPVRPIGDC